MKYGLIAERLGHSFSKEIHAALGDYQYELREIEKSSLGDFMRARDFLGINVTIPYKEAVIPFLDEIDDSARAIGAVNTVVVREGRLFGYNTDFYGMSELIRHAGISLSGKKVIILGTGGTSKTAFAVSSALGAKEILRVSRRQTDGAITYSELYQLHTDADVIINTTPCGMFPDNFSSPVELSRFNSLSGVIDAVYNPLRTRLVSDALALGIAAEGGLYMLVAQAVRASEIFLGCSYAKEKCDSVFSDILKSKENIVLIGMPSSGKTTVGKILSDRLSRPFVDTDELIVKAVGMPITEIFKKYGEDYFRECEAKAVAEASRTGGCIIATGGGAVLRGENILTLKQNGRLVFLDRPLSLLIPTSDRPLSSDRASVEKRYTERYPIYMSVKDIHIDAKDDAGAVAENIIRRFFER